MFCGDKERAETNREFSFWFSVVVLTCFFIGFVFTSLRLVWDHFSELTLKWGPQLSIFVTFSGLCSLSSLLHLVSEQINFQARVIPLLLPGIGAGDISVSGGPHQLRRFGTFNIFLAFLITVVIHLWLAHLQRVLWPDSLRGQLPVRRLYVYLFFLFSFFFLSQKLASRCYILT